MAKRTVPPGIVLFSYHSPKQTFTPVENIALIISDLPKMRAGRGPARISCNTLSIKRLHPTREHETLFFVVRIFLHIFAVRKPKQKRDHEKIPCHIAVDMPTVRLCEGSEKP